MYDGDWRLIYPGVDVTFGSTNNPVYHSKHPDLGTYELRTADAVRPRTDGVAFGTDYFGARTIAFETWVIGPTESDVRTSVATMARAWRADVVRSTPGSVAELHMQHRGIERVVYGRPRRFTPDLSFSQKSAFASIVSDFACADDRFYSADTTAVNLSLVPATGGGLLAPLASPLATTLNSDRSRGMTVVSELPVYPVVTINGPVTNPAVEILGQVLFEFNIVLNNDETLVVDTRPWARTILRNGANAAGAVTRRSTRITNAMISPGSYELVLRGTSDAGTATATVQWQNSYTTP